MTGSHWLHLFENLRLNLKQFRLEKKNSYSHTQTSTLKLPYPFQIPIPYLHILREAFPDGARGSRPVEDGVATRLMRVTYLKSCINILHCFCVPIIGILSGYYWDIIRILLGHH